jgi:TonB family protein
MRRAARSASILALLVLAQPSIARAQDLLAPSETPEPPPPTTHTSTAPVLEAFVEAPHPVGHETEASTVLLTIVVAADGSVESVEVVESGGAEFDVAAMEAAHRFHFTPATRDGVAIRARIRYRYAFTVTTVEAPPTVAATVEPPDTPAEPAPEEPAAAPPERELSDREVLSFSASGTVQGPPRDGLVEHVEGPALTHMAGTRGDALRAVELLPGVGRPSFGLGVLIVRGAAPQESQYFLGSVPVPLAYHFSGITSFFQSRLLSGFDLMLSNFGVRYGRATGGILQIDVRDPRGDGVHAHLDVNAIDSSASFEGPISRQLSVAIAVRRSYIDAILGALNIQGLGVAPAYYDYQAIVAWHPDSENRVRLLLYGSDDQLVQVGPQDTNAQGAPSFGFDNQFHRVQLEWRHLYSTQVTHDVTLSLGYDYNQTSFGTTFRQDRTQWPIIGRSEWSARITDSFTLVGGLDVQIIPIHLDFLAISAAGATQNPTQPTDLHQYRDTPVVRPAAYLESQLQPASFLDVVVGGRFDAYTEIGRSTASPRLTTRWHLLPELDVRAAVGMFSQPPDIQQTLPSSGNPDLGPQYAMHSDLGIDLRIPEFRLTLRLDGFFRYTVDRVVAPTTNNGFGGSALAIEAQASSGLSFGSNRNLTNEGIGRTWGGEFGVRLDPGGPIPLIGFLSYTLMRSELLDHPGQQWHLSPFDQTHIFTLALTWMIGNGFELGATLRLVSGNPYTPSIGAVADLASGGYRPIYGDSFSARAPLFNRLDARFAKTFQIGDVRLTISIDVQNAYNNQNPEGVQYNYDYTQQSYIRGLPIIPSLGLRGEL